MVRIQYASDIHLNYRPSKFRKIIKPVGDILILAGDTGHPFRDTYIKFLGWCSKKFKYVVVVAGNHEYHGSSLKKGRQKLKKICRNFDHVYFLDKNSLEIEEYQLAILGTTLWAHIPKKRSFDVRMKISDFRSIEGFDIDIENELYRKNREWLDNTISEYRNNKPEYKVVIATHHAPVPEITSAPEHRGKITNCAFASDCTDIMEGVDVWIYGHTHYSTTFAQEIPSGENVIVTSNQRGYPDEKTGYMRDRYIVLDESPS